MRNMGFKYESVGGGTEEETRHCNHPAGVNLMDIVFLLRKGKVRMLLSKKQGSGPNLPREHLHDPTFSLSHGGSLERKAC